MDNLSLLDLLNAWDFAQENHEDGLMEARVELGCEIFFERETEGE